MGQPSHPILLVSFQGPMQKIPGHLLILVQPLDDEGLKPPRKESQGGVPPPLVPDPLLCLVLTEWWMALGWVPLSLELTVRPWVASPLLPSPTKAWLLHP